MGCFLSLRRELPGFRFFGIQFDDILGFDVLKIAHADTAFKSFFNFLHIILKPAQGFQNAHMDNDAVTKKARLGAADQLAFQNKTSADGPALGELINLAYFRATRACFPSSQVRARPSIAARTSAIAS